MIYLTEKIFFLNFILHELDALQTATTQGENLGRYANKPSYL